MVDIGGDSIQDGTRASIRVLRFEKVYIKHKLSTRKQGSLGRKHRQNFFRQGSQKTKTTPQLSNATAKSSIADEGYFKPESDAGLKIKLVENLKLFGTHYGAFAKGRIFYSPQHTHT